MSKSKTAKTASKNNPTSRESAREFFFEGKKVKPAKLILENTSFLGAEYESGDIVVSNGTPMHWSNIVSMSGKK
jgi:hypothetical protein